jgi:TPR repeat protein
MFQRAVRALPLTAALALFGIPAALAQDTSVLELVRECDILAAHPDDPLRYADGVADDAIVPVLARMACEAAIEEADDEARFRFQLGRALLAGGSKPESFEAFKQAAEAGYAAAWAYLGDAYQFGAGTAVDNAKSFQAYKQALDSGFEPAKAQLDRLQFDPAMYTGEFLGLFFGGKHQAVQAKSSDATLRSLSRNYVFNLVLTLMNECGQVLRPAHVPNFYLYRYPTGWTQQSDESVSVAIQTSVAEYDANAFLRRHGCEGAVARHVFAQMDAFFTQVR